jgi:hypothetical protein
MSAIAILVIAVALLLVGIGLWALRTVTTKQREVGPPPIELKESAGVVERSEAARNEVEPRTWARVVKRPEVGRPDIELRGWSREAHPDMGLDVILFRIRNAGNGSARDVRLWCEPTTSDGPLVTMSTSIATLASGDETTPEDAAISIWWQTVPEDWDSRRFFRLPVRVQAHDATGRVHEMDYSLAVSQDTGAVMTEGESVAPGVALVGRAVVKSSRRSART